IDTISGDVQATNLAVTTGAGSALFATTDVTSLSIAGGGAVTLQNEGGDIALSGTGTNDLDVKAAGNITTNGSLAADQLTLSAGLGVSFNNAVVSLGTAKVDAVGGIAIAVGGSFNGSATTNFSAGATGITINGALFSPDINLATI